MFFESQTQMLERAAEIANPASGVYARFYGSVQTLSCMLAPYLAQVGTPEDEKQRLIGHYGLLGETNNSISQLLLNIYDNLKIDTPKARARALQSAFHLSTLENHGSQYSHRQSPDSANENVISACNRIINDIGKWVDDHSESIAPSDRIAILDARQSFASALNEIYDFMNAARPCFGDKAAPLIPAPAP